MRCRKLKASLLLSRLLVDLAPMPNARYLHFFLFVVDGVDDAIIADADSPSVTSASELLTALGSGVRAKRLDFREDAG